MHMARSLRGLGSLLTLVTVLSCENGPTMAPSASDPTVRSTGDLRLLRVAAGTPPLATTQASFYAVKGRNAGIDLYYHAAAGRQDSAKFLEFRMGGASLDRRPDGSVIAPGDSVLITLTVTDPVYLVVEFEPSGLVFSSNDKPKLRIFFGACGDDLNYDGVVNAADKAVQDQLGLWRQEAPGEPWFRLATAQISDLRRLDAELSGFTGYAAAY
jgi:hypothetical protein